MIDARFSVETKDAGMRVEVWLAPRFPLLSATKLRVLIHQAGVLRNGAPAVAGQRLRSGDAIAVRWDPAALPPLPPEPHPLVTVWQDEHLTAIDKPPGMLMHPTRGVKRGTLAGALLALWNPWLREDCLVHEAAVPVVWPHFLNRLDRETSGLVLVARDAAMASQLGKLWASRRVEKTYVAMLQGQAALREWTVDAPIGRVAESAPQWQVTPFGAPAQSRFQLIGHHGGYTLALLSPVTGRTNQLRAHAASIGHPITGDIAYGSAPASRLFLHAWRLAFPHPCHADALLLEAPLPRVFREAWPQCLMQIEKAWVPSRTLHSGPPGNATLAI